MVLVQKKMGKLKMASLTVLVIFFLIVTIYLVYKNFIMGPSIPSVLTNQPIITNVSVQIPKLDLDVFDDPRFLSLEQRESFRIGENYQGVPVDPDAPPVPNSLTVESIDIGKILVLRWENPSEALYDYLKIYRSEESGKKGQVIADNLPKITFYQDSELTNSQTYYYLVKTVSSTGKESSNDDQASGIPVDVVAPAPPKNITILDLDEDNKLKISWINPQDKDFDFIKIYRSEKRDNLGNLVAGKVTDTSYVDSGLNSNTIYYYTLVSVDKSGNESAKVTPSTLGNTKPFEPIF